ncbi:Ditrans,polycis-undecaprenyl-diphosphate synthase ((2E,6E)-farnesyl-diphosphate specific) [Thalassocella blandensis]|nr:Ditrans,polycis-undecaprenyl-diphosphate synthase ((2E,6E)-farnesyl-diphosphate specific) [Thalassocella blandensis]
MKSSQLRHVGIIMDGNNRWAKREGKQGISGHRAGVERIRDMLSACREERIDTLTLFAFSSENWRRPPKEVEALMGLFYTYLKREAKELAKEGVSLKVIGSRARFSPRLLDAIQEAERIACGTERTLVIAADYGGCWDIVEAAKQLAQKAVDGHIAPGDISESSFGEHISTAGLPDLDLLIRTGGEYRISNFLLWQAAYAELYFSPLLWPEFDASALKVAVEDFYSRQRRFGKTGDQVDDEVANA